MVILNDFEAVKDAFSRDSTLGRPLNGLSIFLRVSSLVDDSGPVWREHRMHSMQLLRQLGFGTRNMENRIAEEICFLIDSIHKIGGQPIDINDILSPSFHNIMSQLVFGHRLQPNDPKVTHLNKFLKAAVGIFTETGLLVNSPSWMIRLILTIGMTAKRKDLEQILKVFE